MRAIVIERFGGSEELRMSLLPDPQPGPGEIMIAVAYAGVNPVDFKIREGYLKDHVPHQLPIVLGWDASGPIASVGEGVTRFQEGDSVFAYCRKPVVQWGAYADFIVLPEEYVAMMPENLTFAEAAGIPLTTLTAWQSLFDVAKVDAGQTVLVHAGAGGVGGMAIQLAKWKSAKVYTTASEANHAYVKELGADVAIDYRKGSFVEELMKMEPGGVDVVFDCAGGTTLELSYDVVKRGGKLVSIVQPPNESLMHARALTGGYHFVAPNGAQLQEIASLLETGSLKVPQVEELRLEIEDVAKAHAQLAAGHTRGKLVLKVRKPYN